MIVTKKNRSKMYIYAAFCLLFQISGLEADWPAFRGPFGTGIVPENTESASSLLLTWSETEHVTWKIPIPHFGLSTPVVSEGQVWLTTATVKGHDSFVLCIDAGTGEILLNKKLFHTADPEPLGNKINSYASPSPVAESGRVYLSFGSYGTACLDTTSYEVLWQHKKLPCRHYRGPGSSPILYKDLLILTMDGVDIQYVAGLNKHTGDIIWKTNRSVEWDDLDAQGNPYREGDRRKAFSTPLVIDVNGVPHLLSAGAKAAYAYDPLTGRELWKLSHKDHSSSASPVYGSSLAYILTGFSKAELLAIRVNGKGDLSESSIAWRTGRRMGMPRTPSPVLVDDLLYTLADNGTVTCLEANTGMEVWQDRLKGKYAASLLYAEGRLYCFAQDGLTTVLKAGRQFQVLAANKLQSGCMASAAVSGNALFLRTKTHLYRIEYN